MRPIDRDERARFDAELAEHHWLGNRLVGETMRHVALGPDGAWVALVGYGSAALACGPRDEHIGWDDETHFRRLRYVVNNQRYCVLVLGDLTCGEQTFPRHVLARADLGVSESRATTSERHSRGGAEEGPVLRVVPFVDGDVLP